MLFRSRYDRGYGHFTTRQNIQFNWIKLAELPDAHAEVGTLDELPELVTRIGRGPAILVIGDVVRHSSTWHDQNFTKTLSKLLEAAE